MPALFAGMSWLLKMSLRLVSSDGAKAPLYNSQRRKDLPHGMSWGMQTALAEMGMLARQSAPCILRMIAARHSILHAVSHLQLTSPRAVR